MTTLADDGCRLVKAGVTTIEEVLSVTTVNEAAPLAPPAGDSQQVGKPAIAVATR
jgi:hypothetical protein